MKIKRKFLLLLCSVELFAFWLATISFISGCANRPAYLTPLSAGSPLAAMPGDPSGRPDQPIPASGEELWIIARDGEPTAQRAEDTPGTGALMARIEQKRVPMPLKHTDVRASISGY